MTNITDQATRDMLEWARIAVASKGTQEHEPWVTAARVILATVDAPEPTLTERLREQFYDPEPTDEQHGIILDAEQLEHDLAEARAGGRAAHDNWMNAADEVERLTSENEQLHRAVQKGAESNAESLDPADVPAGEAWLVDVDGERRTAVKDRDANVPWSTVTAGGLFFHEENENVTLLHRLVPAPRAITNPDELDQVKRRTVIRDAAGVVCERDGMGDAWTTFTSLADQRPHIILPVTVLWEPEA